MLLESDILVSQIRQNLGPFLGFFCTHDSEAVALSPCTYWFCCGGRVKVTHFLGYKPYIYIRNYFFSFLGGDSEKKFQTLIRGLSSKKYVSMSHIYYI